MIKEAFKGLYGCKRKGWATKFFKWWFYWATHSRLEPIRKVAHMIKKHWDGIASWFDFEENITSATVEGLNNKAKVILHRSYGFRSASFFIDMLYHCIGNLPLPEGLHICL